MLLFRLAAEQERPANDFDRMEEDLRLIAAGDSEALVALYERTYAAVYGFALSICRNVHDAEDVLQETYLRGFESAGRYRAQGKPMAWLLTIAKNLANSRLRDRSRDPALPEESIDAALSRLPSLTETDRITIRDLLGQLSAMERQTILLHVLSGLRHREIAQLLDCPLSTVLSRYSRAIEKLRKLWKETD